MSGLRSNVDSVGRASKVAFVALALGAVVSGCGSDDGFIEIVNDLERPVEVSQCNDNLCNGGFHFSDTLPPGASFEASVSTSGVPNPWLVRELDGKRLGCLPLVMPEPTEGLVARVSKFVPCEESYDESEFWPKDQRVVGTVMKLGGFGALRPGHAVQLEHPALRRLLQP